MKKYFSFILAFLMSFALIPAVSTANDKAPYSLSYLNDIDGAEFQLVVNFEDTVGTDLVFTNHTVEAYDATNLWQKTNGDWASIISPFRTAFKQAGFTEGIVKDTFNEEKYLFEKNGTFFGILSEKQSKSIDENKKAVYIEHYIARDGSTKSQSAATDSAQQGEKGVAGFDRFKNVASYTDTRFSDIKSTDWFVNGVKSAYELGLMNGNTKTTFNPNGEITIAEALAITCRIHQIYNGNTSDYSSGDPWYQPYVDYAIQNGIIQSGEYSDYTKKASRSNFANIVYKSIPTEKWSKINNVDKLPDVRSSDWFSVPVLTLYNAGILTGGDEYGTFSPDSNIKRCEVAAIVTRVAKPDARKVFTLKDISGKKDAVLDFLRNWTIDTARKNGFDLNIASFYQTTINGITMTLISEVFPDEDGIGLTFSSTGGLNKSIVTVKINKGENSHWCQAVMSIGKESTGLCIADYSIFPECLSVDSTLEMTQWHQGNQEYKNTVTEMATTGALVLLGTLNRQVLNPNGYSLTDLGFTQIPD